MTEAVYYDDCYARACEARVVAVESDGVILDRTVFYPMGGGQPGDTGTLTRADGSTLQVTDTRKDGDRIRHCVSDDPTRFAVGDSVTAEIDWERRFRHMRMHTCLHLLCSLIDAPVTGGSVAADKGRLDFDLPESTLDKVELTRQLQALVSANHPLDVQWITDDELDQQPDLVRTMSVQPPRGSGKVRLINIDSVDLQPCGGTHLASTAEVGAIYVRKIEKKGKQNRRVILNFDE